MYIQIDHTNFINKGAALMLFSIVQRLEIEQALQPRFVAGRQLDPSIHTRKAGLYSIAHLQRFKIKLHDFLTDSQLEKYGLVNRNRVKVILDAGGFQFSDQFESLYTKASNKSLDSYYKKYRKNNCKIIFLPQAFGPFEKPLSKERISIVYDSSDTIYARDQVSYHHLTSMFGESNKIKHKPDFTLLAKGELNNSLFDLVKDNVVVIPNNKMLSHTSHKVASNYLQFIKEVCDYLLQRGCSIVLLNHESSGDWKLIKKISEELTFKSGVLLLNGLNPLEVKAAIGSAKLVVSSRFHGLVSGLNQQVPTFCTSWSHKYQEVLGLYGVPKNSLNPVDINEAITRIEGCLKQPNSYIPSSNTLDTIRNSIDSMWNEVVVQIGGQ